MSGTGRTTPPPRGRGLYPRAHYYFLLALLIAIVGFYPSYFARLKDTDGAHHFHGITATAWLIWLAVQAWLMQSGRVSAHRLLGWASLMLAPAFVLSGILLIPIQTFAHDPFSDAFGVPLAFVDATTIAYFAIAYVLAIVFRKNVNLHARFLASTCVMVLPPAISRALGNLIPAIQSFPQALDSAYAITAAIVAVLLADDFRRGKIRAPYLMLLGLLVVQVLGFHLLLR